MDARLDTSITSSLDHRVVALMRLILAASGLLITYIDPAEPSRFVAATYTALSLYTIYSAVLYILALRRSRLFDSLYPWLHWGDVVWYVLLISLSSGTSSIFFFGFFFAILVAAFRWGFASGLRVTLASVALFTLVGFLTAPQAAQFELNRTLVRPIYLLVLGYMIAYWGGFEITLKQRLALLKDVSVLSNPRFGVDRTVGALLERLRAFYDADACLVLEREPTQDEYRLRRATRHEPEGGANAEPIPIELAEQLLVLAPQQAAIYVGRRANIGSLHRASSLLDVTTGETLPHGQALLMSLAAKLDANAFISVPLYHRMEPVARLYLTSSRPVFGESDIDLLIQVFELVTPVIDNIRLVDRLASDAAEQERQRIARDLHDSVIQPYIGLQLGIAALRQKLTAGADIAGDAERLYQLTNEGITDLRGYVSGLRGGGERDGSLQGSIQRFAAKFTEATGIAVDLELAADIRCNDRLAAEVFQMVAEGLSNVRRHTQASRANVVLARNNGCLMLRIENEGTAESPPAPFTPRSLTERATALGGRAQVDRGANQGTAVIVEIPL